MKTPRISWTYDGRPDPAFGTGATRGEKSLGWASALGFTVLFTALEAHAGREWSSWQWLLFALLVCDVAGGVVANSLNSAKRFYFAPLRPSETGLTALIKQHSFFTALHVHPIAVELLFPGGRWLVGVGWYLLLLGAVALTLATPLHLRRPVAFTLIVVAIQLSLTVLPSAPGFAWFVPALFLKIVYGHTVREEPYRPDDEGP